MATSPDDFGDNETPSRGGRSRGRKAAKRPLAKFLLIVGVSSLLLCCVAAVGMYFVVRNGAEELESKLEEAAANPQALEGETAFDLGNLKINTDRNGAAHGNTEDAADLAGVLSKMLGEFEEQSFTGGGGGISVSGGKFLTYCHLSDDACVFLVHVPEYRKYEDDAKETLETTAAELALATVAALLPEGSDVGLGLRGLFKYDGVFTGKVGGQMTRTGRKESLYRLMRPAGTSDASDGNPSPVDRSPDRDMPDEDVPDEEDVPEEDVPDEDVPSDADEMSERDDASDTSDASDASDEESNEDAARPREAATTP